MLRLLFTNILFCFCLFCIGQTEFGVHSGSGISKIYKESILFSWIEDYHYELKSKSKFSYYAGLYLKHDISKTSSLNLSIFLRRLGGEIRIWGSDEGSPSYGGYMEHRELRDICMFSVGFPIYYGIRLNKWRLNIGFQSYYLLVGYENNVGSLKAWGDESGSYYSEWDFNKKYFIGELSDFGCFIGTEREIGKYIKIEWKIYAGIIKSENRVKLQEYKISQFEAGLKYVIQRW